MHCSVRPHCPRPGPASCTCAPAPRLRGQAPRAGSPPSPCGRLCLPPTSQHPGVGCLPSAGDVTRARPHGGRRPERAGSLPRVASAGPGSRAGSGAPRRPRPTGCELGQEVVGRTLARQEMWCTGLRRNPCPQVQQCPLPTWAHGNITGTLWGLYGVITRTSQGHKGDVSARHGDPPCCGVLGCGPSVCLPSPGALPASPAQLWRPLLPRATHCSPCCPRVAEGRRTEPGFCPSSCCTVAPAPGPRSEAAEDTALPRDPAGPGKKPGRWTWLRAGRPQDRAQVGTAPGAHGPGPSRAR